MIASSPALKVRLRVIRGQQAGRKIRVRGPSFLIGRDPECQLRPNSPLVSRRHAEIGIVGRDVVLQDLGSRNGTLYNGEPLASPTHLADGDQVEVGPLVFSVSIRARSRPSPVNLPPAEPTPRAAIQNEIESETGGDSEPEDATGSNSWNELDEPTPDPDVPVENVEDLLRTMRL